MFCLCAPSYSDDKRVAIIPSDADSVVTVLDSTSAKQLGSLRIGDGVLENLQGVEEDAGSMLLMWHDVNDWKFCVARRRRY